VADEDAVCDAELVTLLLAVSLAVADWVPETVALAVGVELRDAVCRCRHRKGERG
jgi:hypothetical protein